MQYFHVFSCSSYSAFFWQSLWKKQKRAHRWSLDIRSLGMWCSKTWRPTGHHSRKWELCCIQEDKFEDLVLWIRTRCLSLVSDGMDPVWSGHFVECFALSSEVPHGDAFAVDVCGYSCMSLLLVQSQHMRCRSKVNVKHLEDAALLMALRKT